MKSPIKYILIIVPILMQISITHSFAQSTDDDLLKDQNLVKDADNEWSALEKAGNVNSADDIPDPDAKPAPQPSTAAIPQTQDVNNSNPNQAPVNGTVEPAQPQEQVSATAAPQEPILKRLADKINLNLNTERTGADLFKEYQFEIASEESYLEYQEPSLQVRLKGPYFGVYGAFEDRPPEAKSWSVNVIHMDVHTNFGDVDYKSPDGIVNGIHDFMLEPRVWFGSDMMPFKDTRLTPYFGWGYRLLYDHFGAFSNIGGYDRVSQYFYLPLGVEVLNDSIPGWQLGFTLEYDFFLQGWQESYLSQVDNVYPDLNNKQAGGYGFRGSIDITKKMKMTDVVFSPYFRYWQIHQSKTAIAALNNNSGYGIEGYEPSNNSTEIGLKVGVKF